MIFRVEETPLQVLIEDDLETLMLAHWKESSTHQDADYDPDWPLALALERAGTLRAFGLFRDDELIGYSVYTISSHLLCKSTTFAFNTSIYVVPTRRGFAGGKLLRESEKLLKALGVRKVTYLAPRNSPLNDALRSFRHEHTENYWAKVI